MKIKIINCSVVIIVILIVLGIGFAPVTRLVPRDCTTTQPYTCETIRYYDCNISQEIAVRRPCYLPGYDPYCFIYSKETIQVFTINGCSEQVESICYAQEPSICYEEETQRLWW